MNTSQIFFFLVFIAERLTATSVTKKLPQQNEDKQSARVTRSPIEGQTAYVVSQNYQNYQTYQPKIDAHQLLQSQLAHYQHKIDPHHLLQHNEHLSVGDTQAYAAALLQQGHGHESLFSPSHGYDISKLYTSKTVKQPYVSYAKVKPQTYKIEQPLSFVYTAAKPTAAYAAPVAYAAAAYTANDDPQYQQTDSYASKYKFGYRVSDPHTGAEFGHSEVSEGHITKGHYHVLLPDGRIQNVKYWADPSGYHATVTYEGQKLHYPH